MQREELPNPTPGKIWLHNVFELPPRQPQEMGKEIREISQMYKGEWVIFHTEAALRREN